MKHLKTKHFSIFMLRYTFGLGKYKNDVINNLQKNNSELDNENAHIITSTNLYLPRYKLSFSVAVNPYTVSLN